MKSSMASDSSTALSQSIRMPTFVSTCRHHSTRHAIFSRCGNVSKYRPVISRCPSRAEMSSSSHHT